MDDIRLQVVPYFRACALLKACVSLLRMPPRTVATALAYLHRWHNADPQLTSTDESVLGACMLLASKVEEAATSNNHLVNVARLVVHLDSRRGGAEAEAAAAHPAAAAAGQAGSGDPQTSMNPPADSSRPHQPHPTMHQSSATEAERQTEGPFAAASETPASTSTDTTDATAAAAAAALGLMPATLPSAPTTITTASTTRQAVAQPGSSPGDPGGARGHEGPPDDQPGPDPRGSGTGAGRWLRDTVSECEPLVGPQYDAAKQALLTSEQLLLRALQFEVTVEQPHSLLLNAARCLRLPGGVQRLALCLLNDLWSYTDLCLVPPRPGRQEVTVAVLAAAVRLSGIEVRVPAHAVEAGLAWWQLLGVARDEEGMGVLVEGVMHACAACHAVHGATEAGEGG